MSVTIYLDESGDLGWSFNTRNASSSHLTIAAVVVPDDKENFLKRIVTDVYKTRGRDRKTELKSTHLKPEEKDQFVIRLSRLKEKHQDFNFLAMTVNKKIVHESFKNYPNGLYNTMIEQLLIAEFSKHRKVNFIPDARSIRTGLKDALDDYLKTQLCRKNAHTILTTTPWESKDSYELQFCDWLAGIVWAGHEYSHEKKAVHVLTKARGVINEMTFRLNDKEN